MESSKEVITRFPSYPFSIAVLSPVILLWPLEPGMLDLSGFALFRRDWFDGVHTLSHQEFFLLSSAFITVLSNHFSDALPILYLLKCLVASAATITMCDFQHIFLPLCWSGLGESHLTK